MIRYALIRDKTVLRLYVRRKEAEQDVERRVDRGDGYFPSYNIQRLNIRKRNIHV